MPKAKRDPDANENAARVLRELAGQPDAAPAELEAAWADWSKRIKAVDARTMTLLRAAFDAGADAGAAVASKATGRQGGLKGGPARNKALTSDRRAEIARIAAATRWRNRKS